MSFKRNDIVTQYEMDEAIAGGGGGGGETYLATFTVTESINPAGYFLTADKTWGDPSTAASAGIVPMYKVVDLDASVLDFDVQFGGDTVTFYGVLTPMTFEYTEDGETYSFDVTGFNFPDSCSLKSTYQIGAILTDQNDPITYMITEK